MIEKRARKILGLGGGPLDRDAVTAAFETAHRKLAARFQFPKDKAERARIATQLKETGEARDALLKLLTPVSAASPQRPAAATKKRQPTATPTPPKRWQRPSTQPAYSPASAAQASQPGTPNTAAVPASPKNASSPVRRIPPPPSPPQTQSSDWQEFVKDALSAVRDLWNDLAPARTVLKQHTKAWWHKHGDKVMNPFLLVPFKYRGYAAIVTGVSAGILIALFVAGGKEDADAVPVEPVYEVVWTPAEERPTDRVKLPNRPTVFAIRPEPVAASSPPSVPSVIDPPNPALVQFHSWPPAEVLINNERIGSAPSPGWVKLEPGGHTLFFRTDNGSSRIVPLEVDSGARYVVKVNLKTGFKEVVKQ